jgi:hypothetical protein
MAKNRTRAAAMLATTEFETDSRELYRVTKDGVDLINGIEVGHPISGAEFVVLSIALQGGNVDEVTVALGLHDAKKLAEALLREREWILAPGKRVMSGYRRLTAMCDLLDIEVTSVA